MMRERDPRRRMTQPGEAEQGAPGQVVVEQDPVAPGDRLVLVQQTGVQCKYQIAAVIVIGLCLVNVSIRSILVTCQYVPVHVVHFGCFQGCSLLPFN